MTRTTPYQESLSELLIKVLCDIYPAIPADGAYLFGQTSDNQDSVLKSGARLLLEGRTLRLLIPDGGPRGGYPGFLDWQERLVNLGAPREAIVCAATGSPDALNTYIEALSAVRCARTRGFATLAIVAVPFHQPRAFISTVSAALKEHAALRIYNVVGEALPWYTRVRHSQGVVEGLREEFIQAELERIPRYQEKGDLVSLDAVLKYLRARDQE